MAVSCYDWTRTGCHTPLGSSCSRTGVNMSYLSWTLVLFCKTVKSARQRVTAKWSFFLRVHEDESKFIITDTVFSFPETDKFFKIKYELPSRRSKTCALCATMEQTRVRSYSRRIVYFLYFSLNNHTISFWNTRLFGFFFFEKKISKRPRYVASL